MGEMLEELFRKAVELSRRVSSDMDASDFRDLLSKAKELWIEYGPTPSKRRAVVMGVDSSWDIKLYEGFYVYAMSAAAVDEQQEVHHPVVEMDVMAGELGLTPENYVKILSEMAEFEIAERAAREADVVLVDGSLIAKTVNADQLIGGKPLLLFEKYLSFVKSLRGLNNIVFISKYSHDKTLIGGKLGDIYYIARGSERAGYAVGQIWREFEMEVTTAYIRLADGVGPLKVEIPSHVGEDEMRQLMDVLSVRSVNGYPYALYLAHRTVRITNGLMEELCKAAGLATYLEAREVLEL